MNPTKSQIMAQLTSKHYSLIPSHLSTNLAFLQTLSEVIQSSPGYLNKQPSPQFSSKYSLFFMILYRYTEEGKQLEKYCFDYQFAKLAGEAKIVNVSLLSVFDTEYFRDNKSFLLQTILKQKRNDPTYQIKTQGLRCVPAKKTQSPFNTFQNQNKRLTKKLSQKIAGKKPEHKPPQDAPRTLMIVQEPVEEETKSSKKPSRLTKKEEPVVVKVNNQESSDEEMLYKKDSYKYRKENMVENTVKNLTNYKSSLQSTKLADSEDSDGEGYQEMMKKIEENKVSKFQNTHNIADKKDLPPMTIPQNTQSFPQDIKPKDKFANEDNNWSKPANKTQASLFKFYNKK